MKRIKTYMGKTSEITPEQRDDRRGLGYAAAIHAALFVLMLLGFVSAPKTPNPVQVELWADGTTPTAAQPETEPDVAEESQETPPEPTVEPEPDPQPEPQPQPEPEPEPPPPAPDQQAAQAEAKPLPEPEIDPYI